MEHLIHSGLPYLARDIQFHVEKITATDHYYTDGLSVGSFLKIVLQRKNSHVNIYFFPSGKYHSTDLLTRDEQSILDGWMETVRSKKLNPFPQI